MISAAFWLLVFLVLVLCGLALFAAWTARRVEAAVPPLGRFIDVDGTRLHYLDEGSGPAIVLVHGLAAQMQHLTYSLRERLKGEFRVVFMDRPGSGYSRRARGASARLGAQAETVAAFVKALGLDRPLLVGHSLGGAVVLATALNHRDSVGGLALIAPLTHPETEPPEALRGLAIHSPFMRRLVAWTLAIPQSIRKGKAALAEIFAPDPVPADFGTRGGGLLSLRPGAFYAASSDMAAVNEDLPGMVERYPTLDVPVGILYGTADRVLSHTKQGEPMVGTVQGATLLLVEGGGHMLPISATEQTAAFIAEVAGRIGAASRRTGARRVPVDSAGSPG